MSKFFRESRLRLALASGKVLGLKQTTDIPETKQFYGSVYVTVNLDGDDVSRVQMVPNERSRRMASLDFIKNMPQPANGDLIDFTTSEGDLWISKVSQSGPMVFAINYDDPYVETPTNAHEINIRLNRVSGRVQVDWHWHEARDHLPLGTIRSIKKRYSDHKLFTVDCDLIRQRLFYWQARLRLRGLRQWHR